LAQLFVALEFNASKYYKYSCGLNFRVPRFDLKLLVLQRSQYDFRVPACKLNQITGEGKRSAGFGQGIFFVNELPNKFGKFLIQPLTPVSFQTNYYLFPVQFEANLSLILGKVYNVAARSE
jgi:hypothetical protein